MAKNSIDMTIDIQRAENGGIVVKYFDKDAQEDDGPADSPKDYGPKTFTFKTAKQATAQIGKWLGEEETEEKDDVPNSDDAVKSHLHKKNIGSTMKEMKSKGY